MDTSQLLKGVLDAAVLAAVEPEDDAFVSAAYRARAASVCAARALADAARRARGDGS